MNPKRHNLEWVLSHFNRQPQDKGDKPIIEYEHQNLDVWLGKGYRIASRTPTYFLLMRSQSDYVVYNKVLHIVEKQAQ